MFEYAMEYDELIRDFKKRVVLKDQPILLIYMTDQVYAISDKCTHLGASLSKGTVKDQSIECKSHHAQFDVKTGDLVKKPQIGFFKMNAKPIKVYETLVKENKVYIKI